MSIASFPQQLRLAVTSLNDSQLDTAYRPERWTIRQVMHHCADSHMNAYITIEWALTESNPGGITFIEKEITNPGLSPYDINEVARVEAGHRTKYNNGNALTLSILFLDGKSSDDNDTSLILGTTYWKNRSLFLKIL